MSTDVIDLRRGPRKVEYATLVKAEVLKLRIGIYDAVYLFSDGQTGEFDFYGSKFATRRKGDRIYITALETGVVRSVSTELLTGPIDLTRPQVQRFTTALMDMVSENIFA